MKKAAPIVPLQSRWRRFRLAETDASDLVSAACYRRFKHIRIEAVVVAELKFRDVERHIFGRHFVERADHAALEDRPETLNRVRVNGADHVLMLAVVNFLVRQVAKIIAIARPRVGRQQANLVGNRLIDKIDHGLGVDALQHTDNDVALPLDGADQWRLALGGAMSPLVPVAVFVLTANPGVVNLDNAAKLLLRGDQRRANFVAHGMGRLVATEAHHALDLEGAHSLLAGEHEMGNPEPVAKRLLRVLKNRARQGRETVALWCALAALPMERLVARRIVEVRIATAGAVDAFRPAPRYEVAERGFHVTKWEAGLELGHRHLRDWFRALCHDVLPLSLSVGASCHA
jgi:hypothetical protein